MIHRRGFFGKAAAGIAGFLGLSSQAKAEDKTLQTFRSTPPGAWTDDRTCIIHVTETTREATVVTTGPNQGKSTWRQGKLISFDFSAQ